MDDGTPDVTGRDSNLEHGRLLDCAVGEFRVRVAVSPSNQFLGVVQVSAPADFRSQEQRAASIRVQDVSKFYSDEE